MQLLAAFPLVAVCSLLIAGCGEADPAAKDGPPTRTTPAGSLPVAPRLARPAQLPARAAWAPWPMALHDPGHTGAAPVRGPRTGRVRWRRRLEGAVVPGPVVGTGGVVYAASNGGVLHAYDVRDGHERWRLDGRGAYGSDLSTSPLLLRSGLLLWPGPGNALIAVDARTGHERWRVRFDAQPLSPVPSRDERRVYVTDTGGGVHAVDVAARRVRWSLDVGDSSYGSAVRDDADVLRVTADRALVAVRDDGDHGRVLWRFTAGNIVEVSAAVARDGTAVLGTNDPFVYGVDAAGRERWRYRRNDLTYSSTAVTDSGLAVFGDHRGFVSLLDVRTGELVARHLGQGRRPGANNVGVWTSPAVDRDHSVYVGTHPGKVFGFAWDGRKLFELDAGAVVDSYPALAGDGTLLVGTEGGELLAIADR